MNVLVLSSISLRHIGLFVSDAISRAGVGIWIDFAVEDQYETQIASYMRQSELILLLVDREYFGQAASRIEWNAAREASTPKLVLAFGDVEPLEHDRTFSIARPTDPDDAARIAVSYLRDQMQRSCFVSYAHADATDAKSLEWMLSRSRARVWIDHSGLSPGARFPDEILAAIARSDWFFLVWSIHSAASPWVRREWMHAVTCSRRIVPILLDNTPLPSELESFHGFHSPEDQRLQDYFRLEPD